MSRSLLLYLLLGLLILGGGNAIAVEEVIPPAPKAYFNDYAHVVPLETAKALNEELKAFEKESSTQIVVAIYPTMQSPSSVEDYTVRVAQAWGIGQKGKNNGVVLFVFLKERQVYIQVGYGLEGAIPDALAFQIIQRDILPFFKEGNYAEGLTRGVNALIQAAKGEYRADGREEEDDDLGLLLLFVFIIIMILIQRFFEDKGDKGGGRRSRGRRGPVIFTGGGGWSGGGSWGGGGGFSGGGGSFGGGGAGGRW